MRLELKEKTQSQDMFKHDSKMHVEDVKAVDKTS